MGAIRSVWCDTALELVSQSLDITFTRCSSSQSNNAAEQSAAMCRIDCFA